MKGPHIVGPTYRELETERDSLRKDCERLAASEAELRTELDVFKDFSRLRNMFDRDGAGLERLSKWQWSRIAACFRAAKKMLDDDDYGVFCRLVDNDDQGGIRMDPRLPPLDAIDKENT